MQLQHNQRGSCEQHKTHSRET